VPPKPRTPSPRQRQGGPAVSRRTLALIFAGAAALAAIAIVLSVVLGGGSKSKSTATPQTVDVNLAAVGGIPAQGLVLGNPQARVTLTEYIDTSCPICRDYVVDTFPAISQAYVRTDKVKIEARVLAFVGPSSERGRQLVLAAAKQNKAWQLIELIYHNQGGETEDWLTDDVARALASKIPGLDVTKLFDDATGASVRSEAEEMDGEAQADQVSGTPTFVLTTPDGKRHMLGAGNPGLQPFRTALDKALAE
jgi:protein-disulfide isomerase